VQQVATTYLQIRALDTQLDITKQTIKVRQDSVDLTKTLESGGSVPLSDVRQAEQLLYAATSEVPQLEEQIQQQENAIGVLLGENPGPFVHRTPTRSRPHPRIYPQAYPHNSLSDGRISNKLKQPSYPPTRKSVSLAPSSFQTFRSAHQGAWVVTVLRASSTPPERPSTALARWLSHFSKAVSFEVNSNSHKKQKRRWYSIIKKQ